MCTNKNQAGSSQREDVWHHLSDIEDEMCTDTPDIPRCSSVQPDLYVYVKLVSWWDLNLHRTLLSTPISCPTSSPSPYTFYSSHVLPYPVSLSLPYFQSYHMLYPTPTLHPTLLRSNLNRTFLHTLHSTLRWTQDCPFHRILPASEIQLNVKATQTSTDRNNHFLHHATYQFLEQQRGPRQRDPVTSVGHWYRLQKCQSDGTLIIISFAADRSVHPWQTFHTGNVCSGCFHGVLFCAARHTPLMQLHGTSSGSVWSHPTYLLSGGRLLIQGNKGVYFFDLHIKWPWRTKKKEQKKLNIWRSWFMPPPPFFFFFFCLSLSVNCAT